MDSGDEILRAHSLLVALKQNVPEGIEVDEYWVKEYHVSVEKIERALGLDLRDFKIPPEVMRRTSVSGSRRTGVTHSPCAPRCGRGILLGKLDALLSYFTELAAPEENRIGFRPPE